MINIVHKFMFEYSISILNQDIYLRRCLSRD
uniref:Uncharacterized protein n=1 Tax=Arundo donax TaxID=35708 RepID=A0A0A8Y8F3_ARUDO